MNFLSDDSQGLTSWWISVNGWWILLHGWLTKIDVPIQSTSMGLALSWAMTQLPWLFHAQGSRVALSTCHFLTSFNHHLSCLSLHFLALTLSVTVVRYRNMEPNSWVMVSSNIRFSYCFLQVPCGKSGVDPQKNLHGRQRRKRGKNPCSRRSPRRALSCARFHGDDDIMGLNYIWQPLSWCLIILLTS